MKVRGATPEDLTSIAVIARRAIPGAYHHLLSPRTIATWLEAAYNEEAVRRSWEDHPIFVALDEEDLIGFADAYDDDGAVTIGALFTDPDSRGQGAGTALVDAIQRAAGDRPVTADVMLGNHLGERFYEHLGFVPGETIPGDLFGEHIVERRWYRETLTA